MPTVHLSDLDIPSIVTAPRTVGLAWVVLEASFKISPSIPESDNLYQERPDMVDRLSTLLDKYKRQGYSRPLPGDSSP